MHSTTGLVYLFALGALAAPKPDPQRPNTGADNDASVWKQLTERNAPTTPVRGLGDLAARQSGWNPPSDLVTPLKEVWDHTEETYADVYGFKNYGWDQIQATNGYVSLI